MVFRTGNFGLRLLVICAAVLITSPLVSGATITVSGTSVFEGGLLGEWSHSYFAGVPDLFVQSIKIDVSPNSMIYDTALTPPGALMPEDFATTFEGGTGFTGFTPSGAALDGASVVTLGFNNFTLGKTYRHVGDVDQTANCSGLSGPARTLCILNNQFISAIEFAGNTVTVTVGGPHYQTTEITGTFVRTGILEDEAVWTGTVKVLPEPATYGMIAGGMLALGFARRFRRS
jgi:hypothetical protein